jgi:drug/metabolite transporter (DMT)-like permease
VFGLLLALSGVIALSPDALIIRLVDESPSTVLFWRGLFSTLSLLVIVTVMFRGDLRRAFLSILPLGVLVAGLQGASNASFVVAVSNTSAANVLVIVGAAPLFAALLSRVFLGEPVPLRTWVAIACVIGGVGLIFTGTRPQAALFGDFVALFGAICSAGAITSVRRAKAVNMVPAAALAAAVVCVLAGLLGATVPPSGDLALLCVHGAVLVAAAATLLTTALRYLPAPEVSLITRLELVLGPLWLWVFIGEVPAPTTIVSGVIIAMTLTVHTVLGLRADHRKALAEGRSRPIECAAPDQPATPQELVDP